MDKVSKNLIIRLCLQYIHTFVASQMPDDKDITEQNDVETEKFNTESTDLKNSSKIFQTCSVNIEELTPGKLDLVKTADPSLLHIKNDISERKKKKVSFYLIYKCVIEV